MAYRLMGDAFACVAARFQEAISLERTAVGTTTGSVSRFARA
jgi:hypothetical protein